MGVYLLPTRSAAGYDLCLLVAPFATVEKAEYAAIIHGGSSAFVWDEWGNTVVH